MSRDCRHPPATGLDGFTGARHQGLSIPRRPGNACTLTFYRLLFAEIEAIDASLVGTKSGKLSGYF